MPRLHQVSRAETDDKTILRFYDALFGERDPVAQPGTSTGTSGDWWTVFALTPDIFQHAVDGFAIYRHPERKLDPVLRELGQTRAGWAKGSQFVFSQHCKSLRGLGVSDEKIAAIPYWTVSDLYDDRERAVLAYTDCLVLAAGRVPDEVFAKLKSFLSDVEIMELTYITCLYDMHAVMTKALRLEYDNRPDPIVEIAAPKDFKGADFLDTSKKKNGG
jgi:alkylhydroperoxidase family enzyme